jgi:alkanesulfonate monooxygenase SsuD/methylene tetrahydromethanopterin reductase-like flavin-dependent oxidoreductase (luciferase family)
MNTRRRIDMRFSLFAPADQPPAALRSQSFVAIENQAVAAEIAGFSALWLADQWLRIPPRLPAALGLIQQLSVVTDRIDLGVVIRLPPAALWARLLNELHRLDDLASGRVRVALDLRDAGAVASAEAIGDLLDAISERLDARGTPSLARRLSLLADPRSAVMAGRRGLGLFVAPDEDLHARRLALAHYHHAREDHPGWVTRLLSVAVGANPDAVATLRRQLPLEAPLLSAAAERTLVGTATEVTAQLTVAQIADGLDEVICALAPGALRPGLPLQTLDLLGQSVLPYLQATPSPIQQ